MKKMNDNTITIVSTSREFFYDQVSKKVKNLNVSISKEAEFYLVELLSRFVHSNNLYAQNSNGKFIDEPLPFLLNEAENEKELESKRLLFRQVGDTALYTVGVFPDRRISTDYYGYMGKSAYNNVAKLYTGNETLRELYRELASEFEAFSSILKTATKL